MLYFQFKHEARTVEHVSFGVTDAKGRVIGTNIEYAHEECIEVEKTRWDGRCEAKDSTLGEIRLTMEVHATRNGVTYGASQRTQRFATAAARDAAKAKYLDGARKRATKLAEK
jgi:hypothetical protein